MPGDEEQIVSLHKRALQHAGAYAESGVWDNDLTNIDDVYIQPGGEFLVGLRDNVVVAMGALRRLSSMTAEIKRMRTDPAMQGRGYGRLILGHLETKALKLGYSRLQLDTTVLQAPAQRLYETNGYVEIRRETEGWPLETIFYEKSI